MNPEIKHPSIDSDGAMVASPESIRPLRWGIGLLAAGAMLFVLWATFAPLDEGVVAPAQVTFATGRKPIQHLSGGVVVKVAVREGQFVNANDLLIELDDANAAASAQTVEQDYFSLLASEARLKAELAGDRSVRFPPILLAQPTPSSAADHIANQRSLFTARQGGLTEAASVNREKINATRAQLAGLNDSIQQRVVQESLLHEQENNVGALARDGFAPRNQHLQIQQSLADIRASLAQQRADRMRLERQLAELDASGRQLKHDFAAEAGRQLAEVQKALAPAQERIRAAKGEARRTRITAPIAGQVVGLAIGSVGGVVGPGQKLMEIAPPDEAVIFDARVPPASVDRVHSGQEVLIRFTAFAHTPMLVVAARVKEVSGDVIVDPPNERGSVPYYRARIELTPEGVRQLGGRRIQAGMQAEVLIRTGERSLMTYLIAPLARRISASMKEH